MAKFSPPSTMKFGDGLSFNSAIRIYQIRTHAPGLTSPEHNKNFQEFRHVYKDVISKNPTANTKLRPKGSSASTRPSVDIKTVKVDIPAFGCENAIVRPRKVLMNNRHGLKPILKNKQSKSASATNTHIVEKLKGIERNAAIQISSDSDPKRSPSKLLEQTSRDLQITEQQLEELKNIMNQKEKEQEQQACNKKKCPTYRPKTRTRHSDCINKRYMNTLSTMRQKLQRLEGRYSSKPKIEYKSVNDTFTQSSNVEVLYENTKYPDDTKMDDALKGIINDIDELVSFDVQNPSKLHEVSHMSARKPLEKQMLQEMNGERRSYSQLIDAGESHFKKYKSLRQDVLDVEAFYQQLCSLVKESSSDVGLRIDEKRAVEKRAKQKRPREKRTEDRDCRSRDSVFDNTNLQEAVLKSSYLMKEFKIDPGLNPLADRNRCVRRQRRYKEIFEQCSRSKEKSITSLIQSLNGALENSMFKTTDI